MSWGIESDVEARVRELMRRSLYLPEGDEKIMMMEEAVRLADTTRDVKLQYEARESYIEAAYFGGIPEKALVAYAWCLAQYDRNPEMFWEWKILWRYKWMVNVISDFPQISKEQIYEMLDDMERRFRRAGRGMRAVYRYRYRMERFFGNREEAIRLYEQSERFGNDDLTDCAACEIDERVTFSFYTGKDELALRQASPLLKGTRKCRSVPHRTYSRVLMPLLRLGRGEEAWQYHKRGYVLLASDRSMLEYLSEHLIFLTLYADLKGAAQLLEKHYHWTEENTNVFERFMFYRAALFFLETADEVGEKRLRLSLPRTFPLHEAEGEYETARLKEWFEQRAREIARRFDERNRTDYFMRELLDMAAIREMRKPDAARID